MVMTSLRLLVSAIVASFIPIAPLCLAAPPAGKPPALLAREAADDIDPRGYWVSEKLDGVRALWDGRQLRFRSGREVRAPAWFLAGLPDVPLDGELWLGRGRFDEVSGLTRRAQPDDDAWREVRFMVFELPGAPGDFTARIEALAGIVARAEVPWLQMVTQRRVASREALRRWLDAVVDGGGEGLMLHRADAPFHSGRSDALLKLKPWRDAEARVVGHLPGQGRHTGRLGALLVEGADGRRFRLGTGLSDRERASPPPLGSEVTYRYRALTPNGLPRFPVYWRLRRPPAPQSMPGSSGVGASSTSP
ncbi:MAG: DNA ligase [Rhodocyclaceae bacterium]|nr:DNA ligase [Rhodocyclaceae bacterium]